MLRTRCTLGCGSKNSPSDWLPPINPASARSSWNGRSDQVEACELRGSGACAPENGPQSPAGAGAISNRDRACAVVGCVDIAKAINHDDNKVLCGHKSLYTDRYIFDTFKVEDTSSGFKKLFLRLRIQ
jgi:hypothetical protein